MLAENIGLELNTSKCEIVLSSEMFNKTIAKQLPDCKILSPEYCELLGAPIGMGSIKPRLNKYSS